MFKINTLNNLNINIKHTQPNHTPYIYFESHNKDLLHNIDYVLYWIRKLLKEITNKETALYIEGYCIDGLNETNFLLLNKGSVLFNKYTNQYRTI